MTAKDKAGELFLKFRQIPPCSPYTGVDDGEAKQCALIAVDEILNSSPSLPMLGDGGYLYEDIELSKNYWEDVKSELEKL